ncbi:NAD(P)-binding domain-containing protein [bacterium]|nr:NAD(P)-binding domain-containing protein [bacterium]
MKITIIGTGMVGRILAPRILEMGHEVTMETRNVSETLKRSLGESSFKDWMGENEELHLARFGDSCSIADVIINATNGRNSIAALQIAGKSNLKGQTILDLSNPLEFRPGEPPSLFVSNTDSLGEQIQREFPESHIVKSLNTLTAGLMLNPKKLDGNHVVFVCGDNSRAKQNVVTFLESAGWTSQSIIDLGDIKGCRGMEQSLPLWLRLWQTLGTLDFNFNVVKA